MLELNLFDVDASKVAVDNLATIVKDKVTDSDKNKVKAAINFSVAAYYDDVTKAYDAVVRTYNKIINFNNYDDDDNDVANAKVAVDLANKDSNKIAQQLLLNEERKKLWLFSAFMW